MRPGTPGAGQQAFGDAQLAAADVVLIPSAVSTRSWSVLAKVPTAGIALLAQEPFALNQPA